MNTKILYLVFILIFFLFPHQIKAVTTSITNIPSTITADQFDLDVTISGASAGTNYLRLDLYKSNTTNYFGETFNGTDWYSESDYTKYFPITIQSGADWSGQIQGRFGNPNSTQYDSMGQYKLRIRRYTLSGNYNTTEANNSAVDIAIQVVSSSPTPNNTSTDIPSPSAITISSAEQNIPTLQQPATYNNLFISEVMVNPDSGNNEWFEIYNNNDFIILLDNWYMDDIENAGSTPKKFSLTVNPKDYAVVELTSSLFNNDGDSVRLLDFSQKELDSFQYQSSEKGKTLARVNFDTDEFCLQQPSKGSSNNTCINPTSITSSKSITTPTIATRLSSPTASLSLKISPLLVTTTPFFSFVGQNQSHISKIPSKNETSEVLGASTQNNNIGDTKMRALLISLSFLSFSFSFLSITSILYKIKKSSS